MKNSFTMPQPIHAIPGPTPVAVQALKRLERKMAVHLPHIQNKGRFVALLTVEADSWGRHPGWTTPSNVSDWHLMEFVCKLNNEAGYRKYGFHGRPA
jgi:hypothetical protein